MNNIHLYIGNTEVEFDTTPEILYTYQVDELTNPTIVKNSFSKTITVRGTKANNKLFGHYWNVERTQVGGSGNADGVYFNASKKMGFQLFVDTELYEQGYVKLDEVRRVDGDYEYDITLYGGLGDFFYNLSINDDGNEMKLSDLNFKDDIDFTINLDTVKTAWDSLKNNRQDKWQTINFMPAYNGIPEDFEADKMLIDTKSTNLTKTKSDGGKTYRTRENWVMAELPDEMTEWETRDLRSYLQRPCIRMKEIINACCNPDNNGGYKVELDSDFFNKNNPYWEQTWLSLPMIQTLEYDSGEQTLNGAKLMTETTEGDVRGYMYQPLTFDMGEYSSSIPSSITVRGTIDCGFPQHYTSFVWFWNWNGDSYHTGWACMGSLFCQLLAFNGDTVVGASNVYNLTTPIRHNGKLYYGVNADYTEGHAYTPYMGKSTYNSLGTFENGLWVREGETKPAEFTFTIRGLTTNVTSVKMCYYWGASKDKLKQTQNTPNSLFIDDYSDGWWEKNYNWQTISRIEDYNFGITTSNLKAVMGGTIGRTGTEVTKSLILNTEASPADYLLSYCKMFGLYFSKSLYENKIYIQTRKSFYDRMKVTDISNDVDYSKGVTITPIAFDAKWVQFSQEQDETQFVTEYNTTKGVVYGSKVLNTGYEFDSEKKELLEGNVIRSAIEGLERSKYFTCYNNDSKVRPFFGYGMKYSLYNGDDTIEVNGTNSLGSNLLGINEGDGMKYYDTFPKVQLHDSSNGATDGNNVLVFFSGFKNFTSGRANPINYFLTDDSYWQSTLNEGSACWLFVSGDKDVNEKPIARKVSSIPVFERYLTDANGTTIKKSLDFGTPQELYVPKYGIKEEVNIYSNFWKTYLEDLYDINTKILTVYVRLKGKVGYDLLRQFYWFENAVWRINKITDWNIGLDDVTKVEFVKVQDLEGYTSITQTKGNTIKMFASKHNVTPNGEQVTLNINTENGGEWVLKGNDNGLIFSQPNGVGDGTVTLTIPQTKAPANNTNYTITAVDDEGNTHSIVIVQGYNNSTRLDISPSKLIVPSNGGTYDIDFEWINQGDNEVTAASFMGDVTGNVEIDGFSAAVSVNKNTEDAIISGKVLFEAGDYDAEVLIDQMPEMLEFDKDGGEYEFVFNYNTDVQYNNLPYWATVEGNVLKVIPNYYETERSASIIVQNDHSFAYVRLKQAVGNSPAPEIPKVSPNSLYFGSEGGSLFLSINIPNTWRVTETLDWISLNMNNGDGIGIVSVTAPANDGNTRSGVIVVEDVVTKERYDIYVSQVGTTSVRSFTINPTSIDAPADGGIYTVTVNYENRNGDYVGVESDLEYTDLLWIGDVATLSVTVPNNPTHSDKVFNMTFTSSMGDVILTINQEGLEETLTTNKTMIGSDMNGDSNNVSVNSNVPWYTETSVDWITVNPSSGDGKMDVSIITEKNPTVEDRTGYVYFKSVETNAILSTIKVTQGKLVEVISINPSSIVFDVEGGTATFTVMSNTTWTITELE
ncbi:MAG: BACON domain-containing carbohydrate-binding protein [Bacteroidales bacterium]|nr:BACON domain-containing carbohydrate-binding protein [Bacteroidales bacterium]